MVEAVTTGRQRAWHNIVVLLIMLLLIIGDSSSQQVRRRNRRKECPRVRTPSYFFVDLMMGYWYVIQYYASTEMFAEYACMRSSFSYNDNYVTMNFTYIFLEDPQERFQQGNITWTIPNLGQLGQWVHAERSYEEVYNTNIIDTDYKTWALLMHCAEKTNSEKYLSAMMLSRTPSLGTNVINFLRAKLPRYDIDVNYMFPIRQENCSAGPGSAQYYNYTTG